MGVYGSGVIDKMTYNRARIIFYRGCLLLLPVLFLVPAFLFNILVFAGLGGILIAVSILVSFVVIVNPYKLPITKYEQIQKDFTFWKKGKRKFSIWKEGDFYFLTTKVFLFFKVALAQKYDINYRKYSDHIFIFKTEKEAQEFVHEAKHDDAKESFVGSFIA